MNKEVSVQIDNKRYSVKIDGNYIAAREYTYAMPGYGNGYGTMYEIKENEEGKYAKLRMSGYNSAWASRGHGMSDVWIIGVNYMPKAEARNLIEEISKMTENAENNTPDIKEIFDRVVAAFPQDEIIEK